MTSWLTRAGIDSVIRREVPGWIRLRSHMALGNTTWRLVVTVIVVVTLVRLFYALLRSSSDRRAQGFQGYIQAHLVPELETFALRDEDAAGLSCVCLHFNLDDVAWLFPLQVKAGISLRHLSHFAA